MNRRTAVQLREVRTKIENGSIAYRVGRFLIYASEKRWSRVLFSAGLAAVAGVVETLAHTFLLESERWRPIAAPADALAVMTFVFVLTYVELITVRERRLRVLAEVHKMTELNHHIRNALQVIQYAAYSSKDRTQLEAIDQSIERIDAILKELAPVLGERERRE